MINFFKQSKKSSHFKAKVLQHLAQLELSEDRLGENVRQIIREEIKSILNEQNKKGWWQIA